MKNKIKSYLILTVVILGIGLVNTSLIDQVVAKNGTKWFVECFYGADGELHTMRCTIDGSYDCECATSVLGED